MMWNRGYLSADQMAGAFQLLRSNDLVWSRRVREYLMGERAPMIDLMAWNADSTRMPYRMHTEYLQRLYLDNELAAGRFLVDGRPAALQNIRTPVFAVGTERDHVAPWRSVYKVHYLVGGDVTFVLTSGGHNAGIVSEPGRANRRYRVAVKRSDDLCLGADEWTRNAEARHGSWWNEWTEWLAAHSGAARGGAGGDGCSEERLQADRRRAGHVRAAEMTRGHMHAVAARGIPANRSIHLRFSQDLRSFAASPFATSAGRIDHQARNEVTCSKSRGTGSARAAAFLLFVVAGVAATAQAQTDERRTLTARQIEALGIRIQTVDGAQAASFARYPAQVVVPVARQRLVAAPLPGLVESLQVAVGDPVRAGQTLAVLRSAQASELQRDVAQATSQVDLARRSLERDEQLFAEG